MEPLVVLQEEIRACRRCFPEGGNRPVCGERSESIVSEATRTRVMLIGQAPSRTDTRTGRPFSGPGGERLHEWLARAELDERDVYLSALTKCYPGVSPNGKGDRTPTREQVENCRSHLWREIRLVDPRVILPVGGMAIAALLGKGALTRFVGSAFPLQDGDPLSAVLDTTRPRWIVPLPHCSGASLWLNDPSHRALLERALARLRLLCRSPDRHHARDGIQGKRRVRPYDDDGCGT